MLPIPNSFPQNLEQQEFSYAFVATGINGADTPEGRFTHGASLDGKSEYRLEQARPFGQEPQLAPPIPQAYSQTEQLESGRRRAEMHRDQIDATPPGAGNKPGGDGGIIENIKDTILGD